MRFLRGPLINAPGALDPNEPSGITVANGLASILGLKEGDDASLLVSTLRGQANVIDGKIIDTFDTGATGTNDKLIFMPLAHAQSLMDAEGRADRLTVVLSDIADSPAVMEKIQGVLKDEGYDVESWSDLSSLYKPVKSMYDMIFTFLLTIVLIISAMGLGNVISMNVVERTREIGALRALGMRQGSVARLIIAEALVLVVIGCVVGFATTLGLRWAINACHISWTPPTSSTQVPLTIGLSWVYLAALPVLLCLLSILAAFVPARRATRSPIVEALGHV